MMISGALYAAEGIHLLVISFSGFCSGSVKGTTTATISYRDLWSSALGCGRTEVLPPHVLPVGHLLIWVASGARCYELSD